MEGFSESSANDSHVVVAANVASHSQDVKRFMQLIIPLRIRMQLLWVLRQC